MRAPSSFHSTDDGPPPSPTASSTASAVEASIGCTGWKSVSPMASRPARPPVSATRAVRRMSPLSIIARRTTVAGTDAASAMASAITPSSAPWRSSPIRSRRMNAASAGVARANSARRISAREATDPAPLVTARRLIASSRSRMSSGAV